MFSTVTMVVMFLKHNTACNGLCDEHKTKVKERFLLVFSLDNDLAEINQERIERHMLVQSQAREESKLREYRRIADAQIN